MNELEQLRKKKLAQMQNMYSDSSISQQQEEMEMASQISQLESMVKPLMTNEALSRYSTVKTAHPEVAVRALVAIAQLAQSGKISSVDDSTMKALLAKMTPPKKEFNILNIKK